MTGSGRVEIVRDEDRQSGKRGSTFTDPRISGGCEKVSHWPNRTGVNLSLVPKANANSIMRSYAHRSKSRNFSGWKRGLAIAFIVVLGLILLVLLAGSPIATAIANRKLAALPSHVGRVERVSLQLWRSGITVKNLVLHERGHENDVPIVQVERASLAISWAALVKGKIGGKAVVENPRIVTIKREVTPEKDTEEKKAEQKEKMEEMKAEVQRWQDALASSFPIELTRFEIRNGAVRFVDRTRQPQVDVGIEQLHVLATDLGNRPETKDGPLPAKVEVQGVTTGNGKLKVSVQADPLAKQPRFSTNFELREMELPALNSFLLAYSDADVSRGVFELFIEVDAANGAYKGYIKPFFKDLDFKNPSDKDKNVAQRVKEKVMSAVTSVLKNDEEDKVATKAPFAGNFSDNDVAVWETVLNLLRNAFIQGLRGGFDGQEPPKAAAGAAATGGAGASPAPLQKSTPAGR